MTQTYTYDPAYDVAPVTVNDARRFLCQATFGPKIGDAQSFYNSGQTFGEWLDQQMNMAPTLIPNLPPEWFSGAMDYEGASPTGAAFRTFTDFLFSTADVLRLRVYWALTQIFVVGKDEYPNPTIPKFWFNALRSATFENFRTLMDVVCSQSWINMFLNNWGNNGGDQNIFGQPNCEPNQNFGRELMQLFTMGQYQLNLDGSVIIDSNGNPVPNYTQDDVIAISRLLAGWGAEGYAFPWIQAGKSDVIIRSGTMSIVASNVHTGECVFLGVTFPAIQGTNQAAGINDPKTLYNNVEQRRRKVLDLIFNQQSTAVYISKQMIQKLVTDNPSPAYISRVVAAFLNNGHGVRGDMKAVIRAILLDPEARGDQASDPTFGRAKEMFLQVIHVFRLTEMLDYAEGPGGGNAYQQYDYSSVGPWNLSNLKQAPYGSPSVFNFYSYDYALGTYNGSTYYAPAAQLWRSDAIISAVTSYLGTTIGISQGYLWGQTRNFGKAPATALVAAATTPTNLVNTLVAELCQGRTLPADVMTNLINMATDIQAQYNSATGGMLGNLIPESCFPVGFNAYYVNTVAWAIALTAYGMEQV